MGGEEGVDFGAAGHGGLRAFAGDGDGCGGGGEAGGGEGIQAFKQADREGTVEAVAGADGVDGFDGEGLDPARYSFAGFSIGRGEKSAFGAALENDAGESHGEELACSRFDGKF